MSNETRLTFGIPGIGLQTPADVKIRLAVRADDQQTDILRLVSLGITSYGDYLSNKEYWRHHSNTQGLFDKDELRFKCEPIGNMTATQISAFLGSFVVSFSHPRVVSSTAWHNRVRTVPSGRTGRLFVGTHPDDEEKLLGLLIEQDANHAVVATTWYRNFAPTNTQVFDDDNFELTLSLVKDGSSAKTDPTLIAGTEEDWYHTVMGSSG